MKKIYLVCVWTYTKRTRPAELEHHFVALRSSSRKSAERTARRRFKLKGHDVDFCCVETDHYGNPIAHENPNEIKAEIQQRIAGYKAKIAETTKLSDAEISRLNFVECMRKCLDYKALEEAEKKLAALSQIG